MSPTDFLTSDSTYAQVKAAYDNNSTYDLEASTSKAKLFIQACRVLLQRIAERSKSGGVELEKNVEVIEQQQKDALTWLRANDATIAAQGSQGYVRHFEMKEFRT